MSLKKLIAHLKQPSTVAGIVTLASLFGILLTAEKVMGVLALIIIGIETWQIYRKEKR